MDVSRETPDVTTKPKCYDLTNLPVRPVHKQRIQISAGLTQADSYAYGHMRGFPLNELGSKKK